MYMYTSTSDLVFSSGVCSNFLPALSLVKAVSKLLKHGRRQRRLVLCLFLNGGHKLPVTLLFVPVVHPLQIKVLVQLLYLCNTVRVISSIVVLPQNKKSFFL